LARRRLDIGEVQANNVNVIYIHMEAAMNSAARLPYFHPAPWMVIGAIIGIAMIGLHGIGHIIILLLALGFAAKWACRWHAANAGPGGAQATPWPNCANIWGRWRDERRSAPSEPPSSGNTAFDDYRREMLRRLEQDHEDFKAFLDRLRRAKDKAEFDEFMAERDRRGPGPEQPHNPWPNTSP
jgi:hypothetical protein